MDLNTEWVNFITNEHSGNVGYNQVPKILDPTNPPEHINKDFIPTVNNLYISTQTKIVRLNQVVDLGDVFWKINVMKYQSDMEGVIKKQMKVNCLDNESVITLDENIKGIDGVTQINIIAKVDKVNGSNVIFKDVRKISVGLCKKDLTSYRIKPKGAFYNCFVLIIRVKNPDDNFKEFHIKVFNTGKLEIPGIQSDENLYNVLDKLIGILSPFIENLAYDTDNIKTVLINSNFKCNYYIDRDNLSQLLKFKYNLHVVYDPCSYPGIQCKFYYNMNYKNNNGSCVCKDKCYKDKTGNVDKCLELSFMIFRTGSILIVGKCTEPILYYIYNFIKKILLTEYATFMIDPPSDYKKPVKKKKTWKKTIRVVN
jgi:TATA-box binding protein (TBP) (component of TFIID and TFIIIB)